MTDHIAVAIDEGVQILRFERPEKSNAITSHMYDMLSDALAFGESSSKVRAVVITGIPGVFTAGNDIAELRSFANDGALGQSPIRFLKTLATFEKPIVAAVDGIAVGIGTTLLFHCDYVVASEWSTFSAPFATLGLVPEAASSLLAPRLIGYHRAFELLVLGETFDANRALIAGLVNKVVPAEEVESTGIAVADALVAKPPEAIRMARRLLRGERQEVVSRIDKEAAAFADLLQSVAARDALQAFLDRRR
jgi:enoyl-CoA hydratase/carnithine racemase